MCRVKGTYLDSAQIAPLRLPGYGGVKTTLSESYYYQQQRSLNPMLLRLTH